MDARAEPERPLTEKKTCSTCGETKTIDDFGWNTNRKGRFRRGQCKPCVRIRERKRVRDWRVNPAKRSVVEDEYAWAVTILGWSHVRTLEWLRVVCDVPMNTLEEWELQVPAGWSYE